MRLWIRSLAYREIITGLTLNWSKKINVYGEITNQFISLKESGHSLLIGSIFGRLDDDSKYIYPFEDESDRWRDKSFTSLRELIKSEIEFEIIGDKKELEIVKKYSPPLYDQIQPHIIWKGKKNGTEKSRRNT